MKPLISSPNANAGPSFRLRGDVSGEQQRFILQPGRNVVGSSKSSHVQLPVTGVSRRHAIILLEGPNLLVEDLKSKNGTFVGALQVARQPVEAMVGSRLRFGPVSLDVETVESDDARLGVEFEQGGSPLQSVTRIDETTWLGRGRDPVAEGLPVIEAMLERLTMHPEPDVGGALAFLVKSVGAEVGAFVEWPIVGDGIVLAAMGRLPELPSAQTVTKAPRDRYDCHLRWFEAADEALTGPVRDLVRSPGGTASHRRGLLLGGVLPGQARPALLATALRLLMAFRFEPLGNPANDIGESASAEQSVLRFPEGIVRCEAPAMVAVYQQLATLVRGDVPVLISGETGVGKEHLAQTIHLSSERREGPFVAVNCAAIPADLLEAEMFGIGKGVATGVEARRGRFAEADGGTLFLDELGDMPLPLQAKLLRALQEGQIRPVGQVPRSVDVRVIAATNADLRQRSEGGAFRLDLYYRIAGFELVVPPLRERREDLPRLVGHFLQRFGAEANKPVRGVTIKALRSLGDYDWPGNVRELSHEMRRLAYVCPRNQAVDHGMLSHHVLNSESHGDPGLEAHAHLADWQAMGLEEHVSALESELIRRALIKTGGNQTRAASLLKVSRNGIAKRMKRLGMVLSDVLD